MAAAYVDLIPPSDRPARLEVTGDWTLPHAAQLHARLQRLPEGSAELDARGLSGLDTSGALLLAGELRRRGITLDRLGHDSGVSAADMALLALISEKSEQAAPVAERYHGTVEMLGRVGRAMLRQLEQTRQLLGFVGLTLATFGAILIGRRKLRVTATAFHMEQTGLDAVPIVTLLSFMIGAVVAFLGATVLREFGATLFTVELVSYSFLREFGVLLTAILLAGRSGSAFTAQIGSMKAREELDAIRTLGMDPIELLVIPRLLALLVMLPLLSFLAVMSGLLGGGLVGALALDISPGMYISRLYEMTDVRHLWIGLGKAPVFAFIIAVVGCLEGMKVQGSAESVGEHTTSSVVQAIFLVILFDAMFAVFFMELGL
jgi:phospholipid/cholesterol/gamma-HCH transport system permease protein